LQQFKQLALLVSQIIRIGRKRPSRQHSFCPTEQARWEHQSKAVQQWSKVVAAHPAGHVQLGAGEHGLVHHEPIERSRFRNRCCILEIHNEALYAALTESHPNQMSRLHYTL
jgi:hypothetical protein